MKFVTCFKSREEAVWWLAKNPEVKIIYFGPTQDTTDASDGNWFTVEYFFVESQEKA